jgi:hypothetical protein
VKSLLLLVLVAAAPAAAQDRWDHEGSVGLTVAAGGDLRNAVIVGSAPDSGARGDLEVGGTLAVTRRTSARLVGRLMLGGASPGWAALAGIRSSFGDRLKTFFDLDVSLHLAPLITVGPRMGIGVQWELTQVIGVYTAFGLQLGFGSGLRIGGELLVGVQFRSYLLE